MSAPIVLVGCGRRKQSNIEDPVGVPARELYTSSLFAARRAYAERVAAEWYILSAGHGLLLPEELIRPYDANLATVPDVDRAGWALTVAHDIVNRLPGNAKLPELRFEIHAGLFYASPLKRVLEALGCVADWPVAGLQIGQQLHWYKARAAGVPVLEARVTR